MNVDQTKKIVTGALLLTLAGLISKVLSAAYRIPLQNLTGDLGFFVYQQIYPLIGIIMILALYGFPVAISTLYTETIAKGYRITKQTFHLPLLLILFCMNGLVFVILYVFSEPIAHWIGVVELAGAFRIIAFAFLCIPLLALLRGSFQGKEEMKQTASSLVVEQLSRVMIIITASILVFTGHLGVYQMAHVGAIATIIGMVTAIVLLLILTGQQSIKTGGDVMATVPWRHYLKVCLSLGVVAASIHMILLITQLADVLTLVPDLITYGFSSLEAMEMKGIFDRGQPLIQFGAVIGSSFALAFIPAINMQRRNGLTGSISDTVGSALALSFYIALGATIGLIILLPEVNQLLFRSTAGTGSLQILVIAILLSSIAITACTILQGLGYIKLTALAVAGTFVTKYFFNRWFVPSIGITGASFATVISLFVLCGVLLYIFRLKVANLHLFKHVKLPIAFFAGLGMTIYLYLLKFGAAFIVIPSRFGMLLYVLFAVGTGALSYLGLLLRYNAFSERQLAALPFSRYLIGFAQLVGRNRNR